MGNTLTALLWDCAVAETGMRRRNAYLHLFMFTRCILLAIPAKHCRAQNSDGVTTINGLIRARVARWRAGEPQALRAEVKQIAAERRTNPHRKHHNRTHAGQEQANTRRAIKLAHEGAYAKAARALISNGVHIISAEVIDKLKEKHSKFTPNTNTHYDIDDLHHPDTAECAPFTEDELIGAIRRFAKASAVGGSGLTPAQ